MPAARALGISAFSFILTCITSVLFLISTFFIGLLRLKEKEEMNSNIENEQENTSKSSSGSTETSDEASPLFYDNNIENVRMSSSSIIVFDLETSGLSYDFAEILQISAVCKEKEFNKYIQPLMKINKNATRVNNLSIIGGVLCYEKNPVESSSLFDALKDFLKWLESIPSPRFLSGHNINFDCGFLIQSLCQFNLMPKFSRLVIGFIDTLALFRELCPQRVVGNYKQNTLVNHYLKLSYKEHNALEDVKALQKLISFFKCSDEILMKHTFSVHSSYENFQSKNSYKKYFSAYKYMIEKRGISKDMAMKFAKANITYKDLIYSYKNGGMDSLKEFLSKPESFVTNSSKVIEKICHYIEKNC